MKHSYSCGMKDQDMKPNVEAVNNKVVSSDLNGNLRKASVNEVVSHMKGNY